MFPPTDDEEIYADWQFSKFAYEDITNAKICIK
jgi:hypothetical protein